MSQQVCQDASETSIAKKRARQFRQQKIPAVISKFSLKWILPLMLVVFIFFTTLGFVLLYTSSRPQVVSDYTDCVSSNLPTAVTCEQYLKQSAQNSSLPLCLCQVSFRIDRGIKGQVYMYYRIINFYQNGRTYASSIDFDQLAGSQGALSDDCQPYKTITENSTTLNIAPCGSLANTMFNDSYSLTLVDSGKVVPMIRTGIAYSYDKKFRFKNPQDWRNTVKPPFWRRSVTELDLEDPNNNGYENEDLMVWLRPGAFKSPKKLHRLVDHQTDPFKQGLPAGTYNLTVEYNFPVSEFGGRKMVILSSANWIGTDSIFLPVAYLIVGFSSLTTSAVIIYFTKFKPNLN